MSDRNTTSRMMRVGFFVALILLLVGAFVYVKTSKGNGTETVTVTKQTVTERVLASGQVRAQGLADIYASSTGIVTELYVADGAVVTEGQELFKVKSTATEAETQAAYAAYLAAQTSLNNAVSTADALRSSMYTEWDEYFNLATNDTYETEEGEPKESERTAAEFQTSRYDWLASEKRYQHQQEAITAASANVQALWQVYQTTQDSITTAPSSGTIANVDPSVGDRVTALPSTTALPVLALTNFESLYVEVDIKETDIPRIAVGQQASISLDAFPDEVFTGIVSHIDLLGKNDAGVINYSVRITLEDPHSAIRHMMTASVDIAINETVNTLVIPPAALQERDGEKGVELLMGSDYVWRPVLVGVKNGKWIEIVKGLSEGDEVVLPTIE